MTNYNHLTQQQLIQIANKKILKVFSKEEQHTGVYVGNNSQYFYFSALWYFQSAIITPDIIQKLSSGGNMLTVGCGEGHLE